MKACNLLMAATVNLVLSLSVLAQAPASPQPATPAAAPASGDKAFSQQEIEQLLAPIALYPDALFTQILMASTYPLEIVAAERWVKANPGLKGTALEEALQQQSWDPSVKSLTVLPQVLTMMSEKIDWTQKLGDAFLAQQQEVLAAAQALRQKALAQGTLETTKEQKVTTESAGGATVIKIEPANPEVVYVPTYNPTAVYGAWPYPAYPPYYYYPPGYAGGAMLFGFTAGAIVGGALWSSCDWGRGDVNVNVNKYNNFNRTNTGQGKWAHNTAHRGAVPYRDQRVAQQYQGARTANTASREQFRGRTGADRGGSAFDTGPGAQTRDFSNRGTSSLGSARASGSFGGSRGGGFGGGGRGGGRR